MGRPLTTCEGATPLVEASCITLGMPHLCPGGLSENWLWKELGHRHWNLIAKVHGRAASGFGVPGQAPIYAAFRRIVLTGGDFGSVGENDRLDLHSALSRLSATRVGSRHSVGHAGRSICQVEMESVFVQRRQDGCNRSIIRVDLGDAHSGIPQKSPGPAVSEPHMHRDGTRECEVQDLGTCIVDPCPSLDFNGAGLLYFSSYIAAVDRAEWRLLGRRARPAPLSDRKAVFHGNIEPGDRLAVQIEALSSSTDREHRARIRSVDDGRLLAEVTTLRKA